MTDMADTTDQQFGRLAGEVGELRGTVQAVDRKVDDLRSGMSKLADAMTSVVRLEVQHQQVSMSQATLRDRQDATDKRLESIERLMPGLIETRTWVVRWVLGVVAVVLLAVTALATKVP